MMRRYSNAVLQIGAEIDPTIAAVWEIVSPDAVPANTAPTDITVTWRSGFAAGVVPEDTAVSTVLADLAATDDASGVTFSEAADTDAKFTVTGTTLVLSAALDYETATSHSVTIRATDAEALTYDEVVTVTVGNVTESTPMTFGISSGTSGGNISGAADQTHMYRMTLSQPMRVTKMAYRSGSQSETTGQYRLVIYSNSGTTPNALLAQTAVTAETVGANTNSAEIDLVAPVTLQPGDYWLGIQMGTQAVEIDSFSTALALGRGRITDTFSDGPLATAGTFTSFGAGLALKIWAIGTTA